MKRILVCEDEEDIRDFVVVNLTRAGYDVVDVDCGEKAIEVFEKENGEFDILLLDIMMPGIDGFEVCRELREKSPTLGIIMLTAKSQEMDKVNGLRYGADDYITKPFTMTELTARIDAVYRRVCLSFSKNQTSTLLKSGPFTLNLQSRTFTKNGEVIELSGTEYNIIELFLSNPNTALDRRTMLHHVWGEKYTDSSDEKLIDVNIRRIRQKIEDEPSKPVYIGTVWGYGYIWNTVE